MRDDVQRPRPVAKTRNHMNAQRTRDRRRILRALGVTDSSEANRCAMKASRWADKVRELGRDPAEYGDLGTPRRGGQPPTGTEVARIRSERYHHLRALGWPALDCTLGSKTDNTYAYALRRIELGLGYRDGSGQGA